MSIDEAQLTADTAIATPDTGASAAGQALAAPRNWLDAWPLGIVRRAMSLVAAIVFCGSLLSAVVVLGWVLRLMQRRILAHWWKRRTDPTQHAELRGYLAAQSALGVAASPVRLVVGDRLREGWQALQAGPWWRRPARLLALAVGGLGRNVTRGLGGVLAVGLVTWPVGTLWLMGWQAGWNVSFHKVYEESSMGPTSGLIGILLYALVMIYLPMAQAHQAAAGDWTAFFQVRIVRRLIMSRGGATFMLAVAYVLLVIPVNVLLVIPMFMPQMMPAVEDMTNAELIQLLRRFGLLMGLVVLPMYLALRLFAARVYAGAMLDLLRREPQRAHELPVPMRQALDALGHIPAEPAPRPHLVVTGMMKSLRLACVAATILAWIAVASQLYVVEFMNNHGQRGWLNHPLIQVPWTTYIPPALKLP